MVETANFGSALNSGQRICLLGKKTSIGEDGAVMNKGRIWTGLVYSLKRL
jgi:hypothetical protein